MSSSLKNRNERSRSPVIPSQRPANSGSPRKKGSPDKWIRDLVFRNSQKKKVAQSDGQLCNDKKVLGKTASESVRTKKLQERNVCVALPKFPSVNKLTCVSKFVENAENVKRHVVKSGTSKLLNSPGRPSPRPRTARPEIPSPRSPIIQVQSEANQFPIKRNKGVETRNPPRGGGDKKIPKETVSNKPSSSLGGEGNKPKNANKQKNARKKLTSTTEPLLVPEIPPEPLPNKKSVKPPKKKSAVPKTPQVETKPSIVQKPEESEEKPPPAKPKKRKPKPTIDDPEKTEKTLEITEKIDNIEKEERKKDALVNRRLRRKLLAPPSSNKVETLFRIKSPRRKLNLEDQTQEIISKACMLQLLDSPQTNKSEDVRLMVDNEDTVKSLENKFIIYQEEIAKNVKDFIKELQKDILHQNKGEMKSIESEEDAEMKKVTREAKNQQEEEAKKLKEKLQEVNVLINKIEDILTYVKSQSSGNTSWSSLIRCRSVLRQIKETICREEKALLPEKKSLKAIAFSDQLLRYNVRKISTELITLASSYASQPEIANKIIEIFQNSNFEALLSCTSVEEDMFEDQIMMTLSQSRRLTSQMLDRRTSEVIIEEINEDLPNAIEDLNKTPDAQEDVEKDKNLEVCYGDKTANSINLSEASVELVNFDRSTCFVVVEYEPPRQIKKQPEEESSISSNTSRRRELTITTSTSVAIKDDWIKIGEHLVNNSSFYHAESGLDQKESETCNTRKSHSFPVKTDARIKKNKKLSSKKIKPSTISKSRGVMTSPDTSDVTNQEIKPIKVKKRKPKLKISTENLELDQTQEVAVNYVKVIQQPGDSQTIKNKVAESRVQTKGNIEDVECHDGKNCPNEDKADKTSPVSSEVVKKPITTKTARPKKRIIKKPKIEASISSQPASEEETNHKLQPSESSGIISISDLEILQKVQHLNDYVNVEETVTTTLEPAPGPSKIPERKSEGVLKDNSSTTTAVETTITIVSSASSIGSIENILVKTNQRQKFNDPLHRIFPKMSKIRDLQEQISESVSSDEELSDFINNVRKQGSSMAGFRNSPDTRVRTSNVLAELRKALEENKEKGSFKRAPKTSPLGSKTFTKRQENRDNFENDFVNQFLRKPQIDKILRDERKRKTSDLFSMMQAIPEKFRRDFRPSDEGSDEEPVFQKVFENDADSVKAFFNKAEVMGKIYRERTENVTPKVIQAILGKKFSKHDNDGGSGGGSVDKLK